MDEPIDTRTLIARAQAGDQAAFGELYQHYFSPLYRYVAYRIGDFDEAEDLTQSVFMRAFQNVERYEDRGHDPKAYLYAAARNAIADYHRSKHRRPVEGSEELLRGMADEQTDHAEQVDRRLLSEQVQRALTKLSPEQQEVVILRYIEGYDGRTTAQLMNKSEVATRQLQARAIKQLQNILTGKDHE